MTLTIYGHSVSGNRHKLRLACEQVGHEYHWVEVHSARGATHTPEFRAKNPNAKVPIVELDDGRILVESNAIRYWSGQRRTLLSDEPWQNAQAMAWMFFEQYSHEPYIAVARFIQGWSEADSPRRAELPQCLECGCHAFDVMESHLAGHGWFTGGSYGVADMALFVYTDRAGDGGVDLVRYPNVEGWLMRVRATPSFVPTPSFDADVKARFNLMVPV